MYHHPSRAAKTGRVIAREGINFNLNYSLQAQASQVNERPASNPKQSNDSSSSRPASSSGSSLNRSAKFNNINKAFAQVDCEKTRAPGQGSLLQYSHSVPDTSQDLRQSYATPSFRDLHKVQRQILHPSSSANGHDNSSVVPSTQNSINRQQSVEDEEDGYQIRQALSAGAQTRMGDKSQVYLPGDRVIFAESPSVPGVPIVYRLPEERQSNPDRLNLDRRRLTVCPILEGEDNLRLLNFQHNLINKIQHLSNLRRLIFLDIYDNQIEEISGLCSLKSLRVLMLGKNRIKKIENLDSLTKLDVLDLHGNRISKIENLNHLKELRVLNLAGNEIQHVANISGMLALAELNLRRNKICIVDEVDRLSSLQRLFLSFNCITSFDDMMCLSRSNSIIELSLDGNPFAGEVTYKQTILKGVPCIRQLDMKRVTEEERRIATVMAKKEEEKKKEVSKLALLKEKRRIAIFNAQKQWEQSQSRNCRDGTPQSATRNSSSTGISSLSDQNDSALSLDGSLSICHLAELDGETLYLYGSGSLDALDRNWGTQAVNNVSVISIKFIEFDSIVPYFHKISVRFPALVGMIFTETSIHSLQQINALSTLRKLDALTINHEGNPVTNYTLWKPYTLFRLSHFSLRRINDVEVTAEDTVFAEKLFSNLAYVTTSQLPQSRLLTLLGDSRRKNNDDKTKKLENKHERTPSTESVGRAGLQYWPANIDDKKTEESEARKTFSENFIKEVVQDGLLLERKRKKLDSFLPVFFKELIEKTAHELANMDELMVNSLEKIRLKK